MYFRRSDVYRMSSDRFCATSQGSFFRAIGATLEALIAAFCRLDKSLSCCMKKGWLVGAVGIEHTFEAREDVPSCVERTLPDPSSSRQRPQANR